MVEASTCLDLEGRKQSKDEEDEEGEQPEAFHITVGCICLSLKALCDNMFSVSGRPTPPPPPSHPPSSFHASVRFFSVIWT